MTCFSIKNSCESFWRHYLKLFYLIMDDMVLSFMGKLTIWEEVYNYIRHYQTIKTTETRMSSSFRFFDVENFVFLKIFLAALEAEICWFKGVCNFCNLLSSIFSWFSKWMPFTFLLVVSKRFKIQRSDWTHCKDFLMKFNLFFFKSI